MESKSLKIIKIRTIGIGLASPDQIKKWSERILPNGKKIGQITSSQTVNYKTLKPEKGGLFCEEIFGPINNYECSCGKKKIKAKQKYCLDCNVEFTSSRIRRQRLGYIELVSPVTHVWYLKGRPSYISILLDTPKKKIESIVYCTELLNSSNSFFIKNSFKSNQKINSEDLTFLANNKIFYYSLSSNNSSWEIQEDWNYFLYYMTASIYKNDQPIKNYFKKKEIELYSFNQKLGAEGIEDLLSELDFARLERELRLQLFFINDDLIDIINEFKNLQAQGYILDEKEQRKLEKFLYRQYKLLIYSRAKKIRRLKIVRTFRATKLRPEWMILSVLPVLPADLRPIIQLDGDQVAVSDLNKLYQKVLFRNNRLKKNSVLKSDERKYAQRLLQESVDALIENGKGGVDPICGSNDRPLKSLSDMLKGKKGRFRQNLLGKRVDYSGRSVIVVGPTLKIYQCGLPKEVAIELFQPFLIRSLISKKLIRTIVGAKKLIQQKDPKIWKVLEKVMDNHPILLNRAPTLHRVGFQAFQPILVDGRAILLHPLVCTAFNADFDGDQMAVHVPLCFQARAEAWILMWSRNNLLSTAHGQPMILPSQDMVLGCFFLTTNNHTRKKKKIKHFLTLDDALKSSNYYKLNNHDLIWLRWNQIFETYQEKEKPIELQITNFGYFIEIFSLYRRQFTPTNVEVNQYIITTPGRVKMNKLIQDSNFKKSYEFIKPPSKNKFQEKTIQLKNIKNS